MKGTLLRAILLILGIFVTTGMLCAARPAPPRANDTAAMRVRKEAVMKLVESKALDSTNFALLIKEIDTRNTIAEYYPSRPLIPASIMKSLTTATLVSHLSPDWRYKTKVNIEENVKKGILNGNLRVVGSGDPTINSHCEPRTPDFVSEIVNALKEKNIDSISGRIIIDEEIFAGPSTPPSWGAGDLPHSYGTGSHGFNFANNSRGKSSVNNPGSIFMSRLAESLKKEGISIGGNEMEEGREHRLFEHQSVDIEEIMRSCMMRSDNMFAESLLRTYSSQSGGDGSTADGASREERYWKKRKAPMDGVVIVDGSGLSRSNRLTANFLADVLIKMSESVEYASFFPLAGQEGTLRNFMKGSDLDSYLAMKTGSMSGIQCYAGYLLDEDFAPTHVIVVMANRMKDRGIFRRDLGEALQAIF